MGLAGSLTVFRDRVSRINCVRRGWALISLLIDQLRGASGLKVDRHIYRPPDGPCFRRSFRRLLRSKNAALGQERAASPVNCRESHGLPDAAEGVLAALAKVAPNCDADTGGDSEEDGPRNHRVDPGLGPTQ